VGDREYFIPRATMAIVPWGKGCLQKLNPTAANLPPLSLEAAVKAAAVVVWQASFLSPSLVTGIDLNFGERWGQGSLQGK
jgi:hypothetical protein